ncbi:ATP-dependent RNA helicase HrpA [Beggiatoa leptomitoformis]|uniref:RNA helicase n=2 Tax=Beggiatoa leptomitoformis TaxID=288004 RepID=A0A2N9YJJ1_9GAMM|nr:ATP-dependent RNA helicase HrpA [Beggiatoa leptomitoformis]AUI70634.1 ATP-dependent RNA helicase HrpA [Beggiatoa leptomitoformis]
MRCDQHRLQQRIKTLQAQLKQGKQLDTKELEKLIRELETSLQRRQHRATQLPRPQFPEELPITAKQADIAQAILDNQVIIIAGETGSGKTTQIPKICLSVGRGVAGLIGCTQPRRIAARTIAQRVANELNCELGQAVGYQVRFHDRVSPQSYIKFMTDGILLAETQNDRFLDAYDTIIIDEAHERSLNIDFLLGYLRQLLPKRPDLKVIITSATIDTARFSHYFHQAPVIEVSGRTFPVELRYRPLISDDEDEQDHDIQQAIINAVEEITLVDRQADILVFLAGEREIRETTEALHKHKFPHTDILPLYARLSAEEQNRVFNPAEKRRIVLTTNVAETSLTVPRIRAVIDTGFARISRYSVRSKVQRLPIEPISQASANQRKGRCGRISAGICIRLYAEEDFNNRPAFTDPEILRTSLAAVILQMLALKLGDVNQYPFIEPPDGRAINDGFQLLHELGAVDNQRQLTQTGRTLAKMPIDPRLGRMIIAAQQRSCLEEVLIIASALSIQDPRERPLDAQQAADQAQAKFADERSDFLSFLKLWRFFTEQARHLSNAKFRKLCHEHFVSYLRWREWQEIHSQLLAMVNENKWQLNQVEADYIAIHQALLTGLLGNIATKSTEEHFLGARGIKLYLFPGSHLYKKQPKWLMAAELVETTRLYARCVAKIEPEWLESLAGHLCQRSYFEPHWEKRPATVAAFERVTLYGLPIVLKRRINYGNIDPQMSREIFIRHALAQGDYYCNAKFFIHNQDLIQDIEKLEQKSRRLDILVDEEQLFRFYDAKIPATVHNGVLFEQWRKQAERQDPALLFLSRDDVMLHSGERANAQNFPNTLYINGISLPLQYYFAPGDERDGVTITVPSTILNQLPVEPFEWLVPGLLEEKVIALIRNLPKALRKHFVPVPDVARAFMQRLTVLQPASTPEIPPKGYPSLYRTLTTFLRQQLSKPPEIEEFIWESADVPAHLQMNVSLVNMQNKVLDMSRDVVALKKRWGEHVSGESRQAVANASGIERAGLTSWDFDQLPEQVTLRLNGIEVLGFPTLIDQQTHVDLHVLDHPDKAKQAFYHGLQRLFLLVLPTKKLLKQLPIDQKLCLQYLKIGHCEQLKEDILLTVIETVFLHAPLPRTRVAFEERLQTGNRQLLQVVHDYASCLLQVLIEYNVLSQKIAKLSQGGDSIPEIKQHLNHLVYPSFVRAVSFAQLQQFPRYLKAVAIRLDRLDSAPHKDVKKAIQLAPLWQAYWQQQAQYGKQTEHYSVLQEFRWLLEELRVSLFAQELKTACPVSIERARERWEEITSKVLVRK